MTPLPERIAEGRPVRRYRVFFLNCENRVVGAQIMECDTDTAASEQVRQHLGKAVMAEVWQGPRMVGRIGSAGKESHRTQT